MLSEICMETIVEKENMHRALKKVRSNKGAPGVDGITTDELPAHLQTHWPAIRRKLLDGTYKPGPVKGLRIPKPQGGERLLGIPNTQDRLIQQLVQQHLTQLWDGSFSEHSYGFRPGRSNLDAIRAAKAFVLEGKTWVVDIDIEAFFDQVNHNRLMSASKSGTGRPWDRDFLGYNIDEQGNGQLSGKTVKKYRKKVRELWSARQSLTSAELVAQWGRYIRGGYEYFRWVKDDFKRLSQWTRRHMRKCFWQRWRSREGRMRKLRGLGIASRQLARVSFYDGACRAARHPVMQQAMSLNMMCRWGLWTPQDFASAPR